VNAGLHILLEAGLMKIIVRLIEEADGDVLTIVQACKILSNLAFLKPAEAIKVSSNMSNNLNYFYNCFGFFSFIGIHTISSARCDT